MAKAKKKPKKRAQTKTKTKTKAKAPKSRAAAKGKSPKKTTAKRSGGQSSEVERTWREYWKCRTELETAVAAVREAETSLSSARDLEGSCREVFDRTKNSLKSLLEVEPAAGDRPGAFDLTGHGLSVPDLDDDPPR